MKQSILTLILILFFISDSICQEFNNLNLNKDNWILISDSFNSKEYIDVKDKRRIHIIYGSKDQDRIEIIKYTYRKKYHSVNDLILSLDKNLDRTGPYMNERKIWVEERRDSAFKYQLVEHGRNKELFSVIVQPFSWRE